MIRAVLFDLDGTLIDSAGAIVWCVNELRSRHELPAVGGAEIVPLIGIGLTPLLRHFFDNAEKLAPEYREIYREGFAPRTKIFADTIPILKMLRRSGIRTAVVTNRGKELAQTILSALELADYFDVVIGEGDGLPLKPDPAILHEALRRLDTAPGDAIMVGDTNIDVETGKNAGCRTFLVVRENAGNGQPDPAPDYKDKTMESLETIITGGINT